ncbi:hypothetical protein NKG05_04090 [Oerskovia sp. M15]
MTDGEKGSPPSSPESRPLRSSASRRPVHGNPTGAGTPPWRRSR